MAGLTVTEREHWKDRIAKRIDKRIEAIAAEDPAVFERVKGAARQRAIQSLGLADVNTELEHCRREHEALHRREEDLLCRATAILRGVPPDTIDTASSYHFKREFDEAVERRQAVFEDELLAESGVGQRIVALRREKESLLDTVWLATSPKQIKELWGKVCELLGERPTPLMQDAMTMGPAEG